MKDHNFVKKLTLPDVKTFKSLKKDESPYVKFFRYVCGELDVPTKGFNVSNVWITHKDMVKLDKYAESWARKKLPYGMSEKHKANAFIMHKYKLNFTSIS